ncbi:hypothetical protein [Thiothrix unzii]|jgi:hypothetical protein|uniref:hypothetical protein n=1 Tax=Thiothrix unzii TaxID=111769 RepID=UPI002A36B2BC|nr:hypothetical protein [Thiothrix unzii]MDX9988048.1 hypothetical protein [Thiothrix unzii]
MPKVIPSEAQNQFDSLLKDTQGLQDQNAVAWYENYCKRHADNPRTADLTDEDVNRLVHELRLIP